MAHFVFNDRGLDATAIAKLRATVRRRSAGHLTASDREEVLAEILLAACVTASRPGCDGSVVSIAFAHAERANYYRRAAEAAARRQKAFTANLQMQDSGTEPPLPHDHTEDTAVRLVLSKMPAELSQALWLLDAQGMTLAEASVATGVPVATLHRRRRAARTVFEAAWSA